METTKGGHWWRAIGILQGRSSQSKLWDLGVFITTSAAFTISSILLVNSVRYTETNLLMIEEHPMLVPMLANGILVSLYLSMLASISVSREVDKGTLETLLYGPVDESSFLLGSFIGHMEVFSYTLLAAFIWSNLCAWLLNLGFHLNTLGLILASFVMAAELIAIGLFSAVWGGKTRNALIYALLVILLLAGVQLADFIVSGLVQLGSATISDPMILVRNVLAALNGVFQWISPFSQVIRAMQAIINSQMSEFLATLAVMLVETVLILGGAILLLKKKGVRGIG